jgi:hypothetical protein
MPEDQKETQNRRKKDGGIAKRRPPGSVAKPGEGVETKTSPKNGVHRDRTEGNGVDHRSCQDASQRESQKGGDPKKDPGEKGAAPPRERQKDEKEAGTDEEAPLQWERRSGVKEKSRDENGGPALGKKDAQAKRSGEFAPALHQKRQDSSENEKMEYGEEGELEEGSRKPRAEIDQQNTRKKDVHQGNDPEPPPETPTLLDCQRGSNLIE